MKTSTALTLFLVIVAGALLANLIALYVAAQVAQQKLSGATSNPTVSALLGLLGSKPA